MRGGAAASNLFGELNDAEQQTCQRIFLRLTQPGEGTEDTKRRASRSELGDASSVDEVIQRLADARLITTEGQAEQESFVEVSHEALIRGWPKLRGWIESNREGLRIQHRLSEAASEWKANDDDGFLYRGARLSQAEEWAGLPGSEMSGDERAFLDASIQQRNREREEEQERRRTERELEQEQALRKEQEVRLEQEQALRREQEARAEEQVKAARKQRLFARALSLAAAVMAIMGAIAIWQWMRSNAETQIAQEQRRIAQRQEREAKVQSKIAQLNAHAAQKHSRISEERRLASEFELYSGALRRLSTVVTADSWEETAVARFELAYGKLAEAEIDDRIKTQKIQNFLNEISCSLDAWRSNSASPEECPRGLKLSLINLSRESRKLWRKNNPKFNDLKIKIYQRAKQVTEDLLEENNLETAQELLDQFWQLYWGSLALVESELVEFAMKKIGDVINDEIKNNQLTSESLESLQHTLVPMIAGLHSCLARDNDKNCYEER